MTRSQRVVALLAVAVIGLWVVHMFRAENGHVRPDYHLTFDTTPRYSGPCPVQAAQWYRNTGQTDMTAMAAAEKAIVDVQQTGVNDGLQHAAILVGQSASNALADPPPPCIDTSHAWEKAMGAFAKSGTDLWMGDVQDATALDNEANYWLGRWRSDMPHYLFAVFHFNYPSWAKGPVAVAGVQPAANPVVTPGPGSVVNTVPPGGQSNAGPPDSSCSPVGATGTYYTPARHTRDLLQCQAHTTSSGTRNVWRIVGH